MKIVFQKDRICAAIAPLMSGISSKMTIPAAEGILIEATAPNRCVLTTYDVEKGVQLSLEADVVEAGSAIINAAKFGQIVRIMDDDSITLTVDERLNATIVSGRASHTLSAMPASDFPEIPRLSAPNGFRVRQNVLKELIAKAQYAMGINDQRPVLNGMYFTASDGQLSAVSCDSFKMAVCHAATELLALEDGESAETSSSIVPKFIVPNKSVGELYRLLDDKDEEAEVTVYIGKKNLIFCMGDVIFFTKLIQGEYVSYDRIIIRNHRITVRCDREELLSALEHAALITEERVAGSVRSHVKLTLEGDTLKISAVSGTSSAYDEVPVDHEGDDLTIAFNNRYLIDSLRACAAEKVRLSMSSPLTSINIESADEEHDEDLFYLLPVRMKE